MEMENMPSAAPPASTPREDRRGPRERLTALLESFNLDEHRVKADCHCQFRALTHQCAAAQPGVRRRRASSTFVVCFMAVQ